MEVFQLILEAFVRAPFFFLVPLAVIGFILWHPWSERRFYHSPEDVDDPELTEPDSEIA